MVMDMGQHVVQDYAQPLSLHQVMVPGLEDRARAFPSLSTARQLSPGALPLHSCCNRHYPLARGYARCSISTSSYTSSYIIFEH